MVFASISFSCAEKERVRRPFSISLKRSVAEVGLYVCHTVVAYGKHLGHGDTFRGEVTRHI